MQVSTKLNRSHAVTGEQALILPTMGRTEIDMQAAGPQFVTVEDTVCAVHASAGRLEPVSDMLLSEVAIVSRLARAVLGDEARDRLGRFRSGLRHASASTLATSCTGCEDYNRKVRQRGRIRPAPRRRGTPAPSPRRPARR